MKAQRVNGAPMALPEDSTTIENASSGPAPAYRCLRCGSDDVTPKHVLIPGDDRYGEGECRGCSFDKSTGALKKYPLRPLVRADLYGDVTQSIGSRKEQQRRRDKILQAYDSRAWQKAHAGRALSKQDVEEGVAAMGEIWRDA